MPSDAAATDADDILVELTKNDLNRILKLLKNHLPRHIRPHNYIYNYLWHYDKINENRDGIYADRWNIRIYGHRNGKMEYCTFVSLTESTDYFISVFTLDPSATELYDCLQQTKRINWKNKPFSMTVDETLFDMVNQLALEKASDFSYMATERIMHITRKQIEALPIPEIPNDVYVAPLHPKHAELINDCWAFKTNNSDLLLRQSIEWNGGVGVFKKDTNEPVAWIGTCDFFTPGFLYTVESERRKGYGSIVFIQELKRLIAQHDVDLFTYVLNSNEASIRLHEKLGFNTVEKVKWIERQF